MLTHYINILNSLPLCQTMCRLGESLPVTHPFKAPQHSAIRSSFFHINNSSREPHSFLPFLCGLFILLQYHAQMVSGARPYESETPRAPGPSWLSSCPDSSIVGDSLVYRCSTKPWATQPPLVMQRVRKQWKTGNCSGSKPVLPLSILHSPLSSSLLGTMNQIRIVPTGNSSDLHWRGRPSGDRSQLGWDGNRGVGEFSSRKEQVHTHSGLLLPWWPGVTLAAGHHHFSG